MKMNGRVLINFNGEENIHYPEYTAGYIDVIGIVHVNVRVRNAVSFVIRHHLVFGNQLGALALSGQRRHESTFGAAFVRVEVTLSEFHHVVVGIFDLAFFLLRFRQFLQLFLDAKLASLLSIGVVLLFVVVESPRLRLRMFYVEKIRKGSELLDYNSKALIIIVYKLLTTRALTLELR